MVLDIVLVLALGGGIAATLMLVKDNLQLRNILLGVLAVGELGVVGHLAWTLQSGTPGRSGSSADEARAFIEVIQGMEVEAHDAFGEYESLPACPEGGPGPEPREFSETCLRKYAGIGVRPEGPLLCTYAVMTTDGLSITARCDADADGVPARWDADATEIRQITAEDVQ